MTSQKDNDERRVNDALDSLWQGVSVPSEDELQSIADAAKAEPRSIVPRRLERGRPRLAWAVGIAGIALLVGSGLGFGLGSSVTPSGSASGGLVGFGFLPAEGWSVMQSGTLDEARVARAITANVPLAPSDDLLGEPLATVRGLPSRGVVISMTFTPRGDPERDARYPVTEAPLRTAQLEPLLRRPDDVTIYRLRAAVGGYNVEARAYFGTGQASRAALGLAQLQLNRLSVAAERVTLFARPTLVGGPALQYSIAVFGSVDNRKAGETVAVQAKDCGSQFFRNVAGAETVDGGGWSTSFYPRVSTTLRAVWNDTASVQVTVQHRARVSLSKRPRPREYFVGVGGKRSFWRKSVLIQRGSGGRWTTFKRVTLTDTYSTPGGGDTATAAEFKLNLPKGTLIRAVMPRSQAKPCYVAGVSQTVRT